MRDSARQMLGRLLHCDGDSRFDLLSTLSTYIETNYNAGQTARDMHLRLLYRLEKIKSMTGMSLNDHDDLFVLEVLLYVYFSL